MKLLLTRRYRFAAAHVLARPDYDSAKNQAIYGRCANPHGHGHDYALEVSVAGEPDPRAGWIVSPDQLDEIVRGEVIERLDRCFLNDEPWFRERVPTAENILEAIREPLARAIARRTRSRLARLRLVETSRNSFEWGEPGTHGE